METDRITPDGASVEVDRKCVLKRFSFNGGSGAEEAFLRRMQQLKALESEAGALILTPATFFKLSNGSAPEGDVVAPVDMEHALVEVPWYDSQGSLCARLGDRSLTRANSAGGGGAGASDGGEHLARILHECF